MKQENTDGMNERVIIPAYQRAFLSRIISIPSVGGYPEEGAPYGVEPRRVLQVFLDEARENGLGQELKAKELDG
jgi:succinyl-diaminopimelate desuccinylase